MCVLRHCLLVGKESGGPFSCLDGVLDRLIRSDTGKRFGEVIRECCKVRAPVATVEPFHRLANQAVQSRTFVERRIFVQCLA